MNRSIKSGIRWIGAAAVLAAAIGGVLFGKCPCGTKGTGAASVSLPIPQAAAAPVLPTTGGLPRLVDLGAGKCIPCKMMAPILEELKKEYAGRLEVEFIDVWQNPDAGKKYGIRLIPTQIFYDASGKERFRHEGFFAKKDILAKWKELGVDLAPSPTAGGGSPAKANEEKEKAGHTESATTVDQSYPNMASGALCFAKLAELPEGRILEAGQLRLTQKELDAQIEKAPESAKPYLVKNQIFLLDQFATKDLLLQLARDKASKGADGVTTGTEGERIDEYLKAQASKASVTDKEVSEFYEQNREMCGGAALDKVKNELKEYVLQQKRQDMVTEHIRTLGLRIPIAVSASWVKEQAAMAMDNPVDKARASGKPSLVDFGANGCGPCDMMAPILETLKTKYEGAVNVGFVHVREEEVLAARYGIQSIPVQVFFDKTGKEVFRHVGFFPETEIEKKLAEMGVK